MTLIVFLLSALSIAQEIPKEVPSMEIVVEAHRDIEVYVAPITYHINDQSYQAPIPYHMIFTNASAHWRNAKVLVRYRTWEPVTMHGGVKVYNQDTIKYIWDNCKYELDHRKCSSQNEHYFLEIDITINKKEVIISMSLYNAQMQILSTSSVRDTAITNWIKQQEVTVIQEQSMTSTTTIVHKPKEELPLEWTIPPELLSDAVRQASLRLWTGAKLD